MLSGNMDFTVIFIISEFRRSGGAGYSIPRAIAFSGLLGVGAGIGMNPMIFGIDRDAVPSFC
jgi:hypothetical protein